MSNQSADHPKVACHNRVVEMRVSLPHKNKIYIITDDVFISYVSML